MPYPEQVRDIWKNARMASLVSLDSGEDAAMGDMEGDVTERIHQEQLCAVRHQEVKALRELKKPRHSKS